MQCIFLNDKTAAKLTRGENKRVVCTINKKEKLHAAIIPKKDGEYFVIIGYSNCKKLQLKVGMEV